MLHKRLQFIVTSTLVISVLLGHLSPGFAQDDNNQIAPPVVVDEPAVTETMMENVSSSDNVTTPNVITSAKTSVSPTDKMIANEMAINEEVEIKRQLYLPLIVTKKGEEIAEAAAVNARWRTIENETFEGVWPDSGWRTSDCNGSTGGVRYWDDENYKPYPPSSWSAWPAGGGPNGVDPRYYYYGNDACAEMRYGAFSLQYARSAYFSFRYWNQSEANYDFLSWGYSCDGSNWISNSVSGDSLGWKSAGMYIQCLGDSSVYIRFRFTSDYSEYDDGPFIDNVLVEEYR